MKTNKKAIFNIILVMIAIGILIYAYIVLQGLRRSAGQIGEKQVDVLDIYYLAENDLQYIDLSARYSLHQSIAEMNEKGGLPDSPCGNYGPYAIWQSQEKDCMPSVEDLRSGLIAMMDSKLQRYLADYQLKKLPIDNYDFLLDEKTELHAYGFALRNLLYESGPIAYSVKPSFQVISYPFFRHYLNVTETLRSSLIPSILDCENDGGLLDDCVQKIVTQSNERYIWETDCLEADHIDDRTFAVCVRDQEHKLLGFDTGIRKVYPELRFAIHIQDLPPKPITDMLVSAKLGEENSVILRWKDHGESDIENFTVFYSTTESLQGNDLREISAKNFTVTQIDSLGLVHSIYDCAFEKMGEPCKPEYDDKRLYLDQDGYRYSIIRGLQDIEHSFAVVPVDKKGQMPMIIEKSVEIVPKDSLAPGYVDFQSSFDMENQKISFKITPPEKDFDGASITDDIKKYMVFVKKGDAMDLISLENLKIETEQETFDVFEDIDVGDSLFMAVIAVDDSQNPMRKQGGEDPTLYIGPEYREALLYK